MRAVRDLKRSALLIALLAIAIPATAGIVLQADIHIPNPLSQWLLSANALITSLVISLCGSLVNIYALKREVVETWVESQNRIQELEELVNAEANPQPMPPAIPPVQSLEG